MIESQAYLKFIEVDSSHKKTRHWEVRSVSSNVKLGEIYWYSAWRQYVFHPSQLSIFNPGCLDQISNFLGGATKERRRARQRERALD